MSADDRSREEAAKTAAGRVAGATVIALRRFPTGVDNYVFEAIFAARLPLVVRIGRPSRKAAMEAGLHLHQQLRSMGVPLAEIFAADMNQESPLVVMERFDGTDLGNIIKDLPGAALPGIAARVAEAQTITARLPSAARYGYAAEAKDAPLAAWSQVLEANIARSRERIAEAGLFDQGPVNIVASLVMAWRAELDALPALAFLHDATTKNVIVTADGRFSGIVDVDDVCFGDLRYAAALTFASLLASNGPLDYVGAWMRRAGHREDRLFKLYVALFLVDFMSEHGQIFNGNQRPSTEQDRARLTQLFRESIGRISL